MERSDLAGAQGGEESGERGSRPGLARRLLRWSLWGLLALVVGFGGFLGWVRATCFASPPELDAPTAILAEELVEEPDGRRRLGASWFLERPGHSLLYLEGEPYDLGYANARLTSDWMRQQEEALISTVRGFLPSQLQFWGVTLLVLTNNRSLPDYVPREYQLEIRGLAEGSEDPFPDFGPRYHRILNYHAAHDISHWVWDKPVVGCNALAAAGEWTPDGHLVVGRNFDFEAGRLFDTHKIIGLYRPESGHAFLSVAWPGMAGAVTGINEQRLFCSINGAHSADRGRIGTPASLVVRQVLQYAGTLEEAVAIIREAQVFVADSYLLADGKSGRAVVVEKTPARSGVREMEDGLLLQSNHFLSEELADDAGNLEYMEVGTSLARGRRLEELARGARGELSPRRVVEVLRDRRAAGGGELCSGNRAAINAMIATHSVVADVSEGVLWVSRGPHQLGEYDAYRIEDFGEPAGETFPADPILKGGSYEDLLAARKYLEKAPRYLEEEKNSFLARLVVEKALDLVPRYPEAWTLMAELHEAEGDLPAALDAYRKALEAVPPFPRERRAIEAAIERLAAQEPGSGADR